jgi:putative ABC transport system permease protein
MWGFLSFEQLAADLRFAVRRLRRRSGFTVATIAVAALGIGATTAVFTAVDAALLRPLPFLRPVELVILDNFIRVPLDPGPQPGLPPQVHEFDFTDAAAMRNMFSSVAGYAAGGLNVDDPVAPRRVNVGVVTQSFFSTLGVHTAAGRAFAPDEGRPGGPKSVIISNAFWQSQFGRGDALGKTLTLSGTQFTIIGIMPPRFSFPSESDLWIPMTVPTTFETFAAFRGFLTSTLVARLAPGVSAALASRELLGRYEQSLSSTERKAQRTRVQLDEARLTGAVHPLQQSIVGPDRSKALFILLGATALLLLIACANIANLLLSDAATRKREVALREVLGASRGRIVRQLLAESVLLALTGALIGLATAPATLGVMRALLPDALAGTADAHVDGRVLAFATVLALVTGIVFGLWPAVGTSRTDPAEAMKAGGGHGATSGTLGHTRRALIVAELAMTVMLLVGSGLMLRSFHRLMTQDLGLKPEETGTLEVSFASQGSGAARLRVMHGVLDQLRSDPSVDASSVGVVNDLPLNRAGGIAISVHADGMPEPTDVTRMHFARYLIASGGYFNAMGIRILRGRTFGLTDDTTGTRAAIINQQMVQLFWPGVDALHRTFHTSSRGPAYEVVGIAADVREANLDQDPVPQMYFSIDEQPPSRFALIARSSLSSGLLLAKLTAAVRRVDPVQAVYNVRTMDEVIDKAAAPRRTNTLLIGIFAGLALVLSAFGVYAVVSYGVTQRAREFGIRAALGAERSDILALVSREMGVVIGIGLALGLAGAWALARVLSSMLYKVPMHDTPTFVVVPLLLLVPALVATLVPALRAMRVSPTEVMRAE